MATESVLRGCSTAGATEKEISSGSQKIGLHNIDNLNLSTMMVEDSKIQDVDPIQDSFMHTVILIDVLAKHQPAMQKVDDRSAILTHTSIQFLKGRRWRVLRHFSSTLQDRRGLAQAPPT